ncbi:restriction endonuclease [Methyloceanibacter superfactus]|uniref:Restriction endonuclease n=1 Tax=Methyloceanibacter superfactus TaxID=1774969 RepID=A0A1E3VIV2_9HYPH|nr:restriction endonuclease [Methyloceanibacter superfactus]ODR93442.1 restriction endonuclease [Methyloceanibacter superfactus]
MDASVGTKPIDNGYVAIGWPELGDLSSVSANRNAFKEAIQAAYPTAKAGSIPVQAGVLFRFLHEVSDGDVVIYPSKVDRMVNIGMIAGPYRHDTQANPAYPNLRPVTWLKHLPREEFSQDALYEIGSFITLFAVRNYADEFIAALEERPQTSAPDEAQERRDDETVTQVVAAQAEETTNDFVIRQLKRGIDAYEFEHFVAHLLECLGFHTRVTQKSGDGGVDIIAHRDRLGFEPPVIKVQCKQVTNPIGRNDVTQLLGNVADGEHGLFVTLGTYTKDAREVGRSNPKLRLVEGEQLVEMIFDHYDRFEPRYQALLPLKRIYIPSLKDGS